MALQAEEVVEKAAAVSPSRLLLRGVAVEARRPLSSQDVRSDDTSREIESREHIRCNSGDSKTQNERNVTALTCHWYSGILPLLLPMSPRPIPTLYFPFSSIATKPLGTPFSLSNFSNNPFLKSPCTSTSFNPTPAPPLAPALGAPANGPTLVLVPN